MGRSLLAKIRAYPVTCGVFAAAVVLFPAGFLGEERGVWIWGGPGELWSGKVWRLWFDHLLHGGPGSIRFGILHLAFNLYYVWVLGRAVEAVYRPGMCGVFLLGCAWFVGLAGELTIEPRGIGLSGLVYGLFGFAWATRVRDHRLQDALDPALVQVLIVWLFAAVALTYGLGWSIGNVAHVSGLAYGWAFGKVVFPTHRKPAWWRPAFAASHLALAAGTIYAVLPWHSAEWHEWKGMNADSAAERIGWLEGALERDRSRNEARFHLALALAQVGRASEAVEHLSILEEAEPRDPRFPEAALRILEEAGRDGEARKHEERLKRIEGLTEGDGPP